MTPPLLKICGLTQSKDALAAIEAGANLLGLIFVPNTPRFLTLEQGKTLLEAIRSTTKSTQTVGVFQNSSLDDIETHCDALSLDWVQLHGEESPEFCQQLPRPVIKTLLLKPETTLNDLSTKAETYLAQSNVKLLLLDLPKGSRYKSILEAPQSSKLVRLLAEFPVLLAGGLKPENIETILNTLQPRGVDVASGVEQTPGQKDHAKMQTFGQQVQNFKIPQNGEPLLCNL